MTSYQHEKSSYRQVRIYPGCGVICAHEDEFRSYVYDILNSWLGSCRACREMELGIINEWSIRSCEYLQSGVNFRSSIMDNLTRIMDKL
ncbi:hypothetical protein RSAG8_06375, partial [Rhizoctonia solani AG-8 WAC10335]